MGLPIVTAKAVHGQAKGLGGAATLRTLFVARLEEEPDRKRQNEKREFGGVDAARTTNAC